jgi:hypothetical protein
MLTTAVNAMKKSKQDKLAKTQDRPHTLSLLLSIMAIIVSGFSFWESRQARKLNYESSLPVLSAQVQLVEPLATGKQIQFKVTLENLGRTAARKMSTSLQFRFQKSTMPFEVSYLNQGTFKGPVSDLAPGGHTTLFTTNPLSLAHDDDVAAVLSGEFRLYLFGKATYNDIEGQPHEFHVCRYYDKSLGPEPLRLYFCDSYNDAT